MTDIESRIRDSFARQSIMATLGARLAAIGPGRVVIEAEAAPHLRQQQGFAHGGLVFALGDSAAGYAALTTMAEGVEVMTVEMKVNFLAAASGLLRAEGRVVRAGRRIVVVTAEVIADGRPAALLQGTMIPV